mgnify:CR=1 FL=1
MQLYFGGSSESYQWTNFIGGFLNTDLRYDESTQNEILRHQISTCTCESLVIEVFFLNMQLAISANVQFYFSIQFPIVMTDIMRR